MIGRIRAASRATSVVLGVPRRRRDSKAPKDLVAELLPDEVPVRQGRGHRGAGRLALGDRPRLSAVRGPRRSSIASPRSVGPRPAARPRGRAASSRTTTAAGRLAQGRDGPDADHAGRRARNTRSTTRSIRRRTSRPGMRHLRSLLEPGSTRAGRWRPTTPGERRGQPLRRRAAVPGNAGLRAARPGAVLRQRLGPAPAGWPAVRRCGLAV